MSIEIRSATARDVPLLAKMNDRLVTDQGSENPYSLLDLETRFRDWMASDDWCIDLFENVAKPAGYAVYQERPDYYLSERQVVYLRHFFIDRGYRGKGFGTAIFNQMRAERFPEGVEIALDVVAENSGGDRFWRRLGFTPYFTEMKLPPNHPEAGTDT